jgi:hypothetical protein
MAQNAPRCDLNSWKVRENLSVSVENSYLCFLLFLRYLYSFEKAFLWCLYSITLFYRLYNDWRKDKEINALLKEKDRTIQRLAEENRLYRIKELKSQGFSEDYIEKFILRNEFENPSEARKTLEGARPLDSPKQLQTGKTTKPRGKS